MSRSDERQHVVLADRTEGDRTRKDEFVVPLEGRKRGRLESLRCEELCVGTSSPCGVSRTLSPTVVMPSARRSVPAASSAAVRSTRGGAGTTHKAPSWPCLVERIGSDVMSADPIWKLRDDHRSLGKCHRPMRTSDPYESLVDTWLMRKFAPARVRRQHPGTSTGDTTGPCTIVTVRTTRSRVLRRQSPQGHPSGDSLGGLMRHFAKPIGRATSPNRAKLVRLWTLPPTPGSVPARGEPEAGRS